MKVVAHPREDWKIKSPCNGLARALKRGCRFIFSRGVSAVIEWAKGIIRMGGEVYHGEICNIHEMFTVVVALMYTTTSSKSG